MRTNLIVGLTLLAVAFTIGTIDIYAPCLPVMQREFAVTAAHMQWTVSVYTIASGICSVFIGPLADAYGRRPFVIYSLLGLVISSFGCALTAHIGVFTSWRFVQGLLGAVVPVLSLAILSDILDRKYLGKVLAWMGSTVTFSVAVAPMLGGFLGQHFGWRSIFYFIAVGMFFMWFILARELHETGSPHKNMSFKTILSEYVPLCKDPVVWGFATINPLILGGFVSYITTSSYYYIQVLGLSISTHGYIIGISIFANVLVSLWVSHLIERFEPLVIFKAGVALAVLGVAFFGGFIVADMTNPYLLIIPCAFVSAALGCVFPPSTSLIMERHRSRAGSVSSFLAMIRTFIMAAALLLSGIVYNHTLFSTAGILMGSILLAFIIYVPFMRWVVPDALEE